MSNSKVTIIPVKRKYTGATRTAIYCRVSSARKAQQESLAAQISALTGLVAHLPDCVLMDTYIDIASGSTLEGRPGFQRLLNDCKNGKIQYVITKSASRFGRDIVVALDAVNQLRTAGINIFFMTEEIDSSNPDLQIYLTAHLAFAEQENLSRSDNIKWGLTSGCSQGSSALYSKVCYGYQHDNDGNLVIKEDEAVNVCTIFQLYIEGNSILQIIKELQRKHIPSPSGKEKWNKRYIEKMLSNIKYTGDAAVNLEEGTYIYSNHHPAIISKDIYEAVQFQKKRRSNVVQKADGTTERAATKYSGKRVVRETKDYYKLAAELGLDDEQTETFIKNIRDNKNRKR